MVIGFAVRVAPSRSPEGLRTGRMGYRCDRPVVSCLANREFCPAQGRTLSGSEGWASKQMRQESKLISSATTKVTHKGELCSEAND